MTFSRRCISLSENYSKTIEGKLAGFLSVKDVDLIQSNVTLVSILVTIDYFLGEKHIESMLYASTQPEGELLSNR